MQSALFRWTILFLTFCTGFSGLVYEVVWHAYLSNVIGSHARSAAVIVAVFLGGLSIGYALFGKLSLKRSPAQLLAIYGSAELAIGFWAILFPRLLPAVSAINAIEQFLPGLSGDIFRCILLILVPTILMGGTLPLLTQALARTLRDSASLHARIYAVNTGGAFVGCLAAGFLILPNLGLPITVISMGFINAFAGLILLIISRSAPSDAPLPASADIQPLAAEESIPGFLFPAALTVSLIAGFVSISLQMIVMRLIGLSAGSSPYAFSMSVSAFILMLALGAWRLSENARRPVSLTFNQTLVTAGILLIVSTVPFWPYTAHLTRSLLTSVPFNFFTFHLILFVLLSMILLLAVGAMGNTLPTLFRLVQSDLQSLGNRVGWLYGVNTAGCVLGALFGGYLLLYTLDFFRILQILGVCTVVSVLISGYLIERKNRSGTLALTCFALLGLALLPAWPIERLGIGVFRLKSATASSYQGIIPFYREFLAGGEMVAYKDDPNTTVAVLKSATGDLSIHVNGKSDGSTGGSDQTTTKLLAHLPLLFGERKENRVAIIGYGTGITAGTAALHSNISQIDVIEIAPFIRTFSPLFDFANHDSSHNQAITWHIEDAFRFLTRSETSSVMYDAIVSEPSNPWVAGVERLYAKEFYQLAKNRLSPGGIYTQWFHTYSMSRETLALVLNTFHRSWEHVRVFVNDMDLILLGSRQPIAVSAIERARLRFHEPAVLKDLTANSFPSLDALLATELSVPPGSYLEAGVQTLDFPRLSYQAGYDFFLGSSISANAYMEDPRWRSKSYARWPQSLLAKSLLSTEQKFSLRQIASLICRTGTPAIDSGWQHLTRRCRQALLAAATYDEIESRTRDADATIAVLRSYIISEVPADRPILTPDQQLQELRQVNEYISPWYRPSAASLRMADRSCLSSPGQISAACRLMVAQAAVWSNQESPVAAEILSSISPAELSPHLRETWSTMRILAEKPPR